MPGKVKGEFVFVLLSQCLTFRNRLLSTSRGSMDDVPLSWEGPVVDKAWQLLSDLLEKHDTSENAYSYRKAVVEKLLSMDSNVRLPSWLTTFYQAHAPEDLIQAYLRHGSWMQLLPFVTQHLHGAAMSFPGSLVPKPAGRWMPYSLLDQLLDHFKKTSDQSHPVNLEKGARELQMALQVYMAQVESESRSILSQ